jgi:hypothetical protein
MILFASIIGGAKPVGAVKAVPMVTNVPPVPAHKGTKTLSDMRNVVSTKAASNWSKKVYEPVQKQLQSLLDAEIPTLRPQPQLSGIGEALPRQTFGEALNGLTTYKMGNVSKGQSKALDKVEESGGKANVERINDQGAVAKGTGNDSKKTSGINFGSIEKLESHFGKHGGEFGRAYSNADEYLAGANDVIKNGIKVQYNYNGELRTGYVKFMKNSSLTNAKGVPIKSYAKFEFVGTNNLGEITTYHVESGKTFWKMMNNGKNIPVINPVE